MDEHFKNEKIGTDALRKKVEKMDSCVGEIEKCALVKWHNCVTTGVEERARETEEKIREHEERMKGRQEKSEG